eukprot:4097428-Prymnesium_polylepis.1
MIRSHPRCGHVVRQRPHSRAEQSVGEDVVDGRRHCLSRPLSPGRDTAHSVGVDVLGCSSVVILHRMQSRGHEGYRLTYSWPMADVVAKG